jgi:thymidine kinase
MNVFRPNWLEMYIGPMKSGKTKRLVEYIDTFQYLENINYIVFKPSLDTRDNTMKTRFGDTAVPATYITPESLQKIYKEGKNYNIIIIDEIQFFDIRIVDIINDLIRMDKMVIVGGLNLAFNNTPFPTVEKLLPFAMKIEMCYGICEHPGCNKLSTRTQRLINNKPAAPDSPLVRIEGGGETYETRCISHYEI